MKIRKEIQRAIDVCEAPDNVIVETELENMLHTGTDVQTVWFTILYNVEGMYRPATFNDPEETPDLEIEDYFAFATGEDKKPIPRHLVRCVEYWCEQYVKDFEDKLETVCWEDYDSELADSNLEAAIAIKESKDDLRGMA